MIAERVELKAGVGSVIYKAGRPNHVLMIQEKTAKRGSGKLRYQWGFPYETVESGETHQNALLRTFQEEVQVLRGSIHIPQDLEAAKLAIVRVSRPEDAAWVHAYPITASNDAAFGKGEFESEVGHPVWLDIQKVLAAEKGSNRILFKSGTFDIARAHINRIKQPRDLRTRIIESPSNPPAWDVYRMIEQGFTQIEALFHMGIDPEPLIASDELIRSLE